MELLLLNPFIGIAPMNDKALAQLRAHLQNISRYRALLQTRLTVLEQDFIERRIAEEEAAVNALASGRFPSPSKLPNMPPPKAA
jgi:hypothetical protein